MSQITSGTTSLFERLLGGRAAGGSQDAARDGSSGSGNQKDVIMYNAVAQYSFMKLGSAYNRQMKEHTAFFGPLLAEVEGMGDVLVDCGLADENRKPVLMPLRIAVDEIELAMRPSKPLRLCQQEGSGGGGAGCRSEGSIGAGNVLCGQLRKGFQLACEEDGVVAALKMYSRLLPKASSASVATRAIANLMCVTTVGVSRSRALGLQGHLLNAPGLPGAAAVLDGLEDALAEMARVLAKSAPGAARMLGGLSNLSQRKNGPLAPEVAEAVAAVTIPSRLGNTQEASEAYAEAFTTHGKVLRHLLCNMWRWVLPEIKMLERYGVHGDFNDVDITTQQTILQLTGTLGTEWLVEEAADQFGMRALSKDHDVIYQEMCRFFQPDDSELQRFLHIYTPNQFGGGEAADLLLSSMPGVLRRQLAIYEALESSFAASEAKTAAHFAAVHKRLDTIQAKIDALLALEAARLEEHSGPMGPGPQQPPPDVAAAAALQAEAAAAAAAVPAPEPSDDEPLYIGDDEPVLVDSSLPVDAISELLLQMALRGAGNE